MSKKTKILLGHSHLAYVNTELLTEFRIAFGIVTFSTWVRGLVNERFGITLNSEAEISQLLDKVKELYYDDIGEWLQDEMRSALFHKTGGNHNEKD